MSESTDRSERLPALASLLREFFVDFLSSMIPGFLFTTLAVPLCLGTSCVLYPEGFVWADIERGLREYNSAVVCLVLVFSYVVGCIFSRRDPKIPDQKSAALIMRGDRDDPKRSVIQDRREPLSKSKRLLLNASGHISKNLKRRLEVQFLANGTGGQFPYSHLYEYLKARNLDHLAEHVPWHGSDKEIDARSKMFINILKIRLQFHHHNRCGEIVRNEAHVRMMSSMWFAAKQLEWVLAVLMILTVTVSWLRGVTLHPPYPPDKIVLASVLVLLLISVQWLCRSILKFLHYQRVREIVYVLETAYTALRNGQNGIFEGLGYEKPAVPSSKVPAASCG